MVEVLELSAGDMRSQAESPFVDSQRNCCPSIERCIALRMEMTRELNHAMESFAQSGNINLIVSGSPAAT